MAFRFDKDYVLENDHVRMSPLRISHLDMLYASADNSNVWSYFLDKGHGVQLEGYIKHALKMRAMQEEYSFVIFSKINQEYVGMTRVYEVQYSNRSVKIGHTWLNENYWGKGINQICKYLLFEFIFDTLQMNRIGFGVSSENHRSLHALERIGCKREGILREYLPSADGNQKADIILWSILQKEWQMNVREELKRYIDKKLTY